MFIPCLGAYLTPDLLGGGKSVMIGNLVQNQFTTARDWPFGSAVSLVLMAIVMAAAVRLIRAAAIGKGCCEARAGRLRLVRRGAYLFLHVPLLVLVAFSFNARGSRSGKASRCTGIARRSTIPNWPSGLEQPDHRDRAPHCSRPSSARLCAYGLWKRNSPVLAARSILSLVTPEIVTGISLLAFFQCDLPLPAFATRDAHGDPGARVVLHRLRRDRGDGAAAHGGSRASKRRRWIWARTNGRPSAT